MFQFHATRFRSTILIGHDTDFTRTDENIITEMTFQEIIKQKDTFLIHVSISRDEATLRFPSVSLGS